MINLYHELFINNSISDETELRLAQSKPMKNCTLKIFDNLVHMVEAEDYAYTIRTCKKQDIADLNIYILPLLRRGKEND